MRQPFAKPTFLRIVVFAIFHSPLHRLLNYLANKFEAGTPTGIGTWVRKRQTNNIQILIYHRVNDEHDPFFPATPIQVFTEQMRYLASHFSVCSLESALERLRRHEVPENAIVLTFDDGYKDNYVNAFPILKRYSVPATVFVATGSIGTGKILWHDRVFTAFRKTKELSLSGYGKHDEMTFRLSTLDQKLAAQKSVLRFLRSLDELDKQYWINRLVEQLRVEDTKIDSDLMLSWGDIRSMKEGGIAFGSHTVTHPILSKVSLDLAKEEIFDSKKALARELGTDVTTFAYPNGGKDDFTPAVKSLIREAGYECAVTTIMGANGSGQDIFELRRGGPWESYLPLFAVKLNWYKFLASA